MQVIGNVIEKLENERKMMYITGGKVIGGITELQVPENLVIIGDIHGDLQSLFKALNGFAFRGFLSNPKNKIIFLGDYVDRGNDSIGVLYSLCCLKQKYPDSIILMRGNHEAPIEFPISGHDLPYEILENYGDFWGKLIYNKMILRFFRLLTLLVLVEGKLLLVHGGLPTEKIEPLMDFRRLIAYAQENHLRNKILEEILWNDPWRHSSAKRDWDYSTRGIGRLFGITISKQWLGMSETEVLVRGHEPCQGFKIDHKGMVITVFSSRESYPNYDAAYIRLSREQLESIHNGTDLSHYVIKIS